MFLFRLLQGSNLGKQPQPRRRWIHVLTHPRTVWFDRPAHKLRWIWITMWNQSLIKYVSNFCGEHIFSSLGTLSLKTSLKNSFLVCIIMIQQIGVRKCLTHAAEGPWKSMYCTTGEIFGFYAYTEKQAKETHILLNLSKDFLTITFISAD